MLFARQKAFQVAGRDIKFEAAYYADEECTSNILICFLQIWVT